MKGKLHKPDLWDGSTLTGAQPQRGGRNDLCLLHSKFTILNSGRMRKGTVNKFKMNFQLVMDNNNDFIDF